MIATVDMILSAHNQKQRPLCEHILDINLIHLCLIDVWWISVQKSMPSVHFRQLLPIHYWLRNIWQSNISLTIHFKMAIPWLYIDSFNVLPSTLHICSCACYNLREEICMFLALSTLWQNQNRHERNTSVIQQSSWHLKKGAVNASSG